MLIPPGGSRRSSRSSPGTSHGHRGATSCCVTSGWSDRATTLPGPACESHRDKRGHHGQNAPSQPSPALSEDIHGVTAHQEPQSSGFEQGRDQLIWGQEKAQPSSEWSHPGQGCSDTLQTKALIPHPSAGALYPHHTERKGNKELWEGRRSSRAQPAGLPHTQLLHLPPLQGSGPGAAPPPQPSPRQIGYGS